jgi:hypothetical protein
LLRFEAKITKSKRSEKFKAKKSEIRFALFRFKAKITQVKRSENKRKEAKKEK